MNYDKLLTAQDVALQKARGIIGKLSAVNAERFAGKHGFFITHYDQVNDEWHFLDGEVFSTRRIIIENTEDLVGNLEPVAPVEEKF